ncbi:hypothetical protein HELRODRAFT_67684 [Helobdella robusta]|uniref:RING-type domain-containing protein n=1 Tax=Helobdella robusta TaxID=6412 RepID=T1FZ39_HELRO|nr:hypothetical protein HELRODRAFT_67684 [Helobdella robusta]ESN96466.1 hypothetical protein HELRODRAFT_67684 [Helobdella robusta]
MRDAQRRFYSIEQEPTTVNDVIEKEHFIASITHTDFFQSALQDNDKLTLPFYEEKFIDKLCPICMEEFCDGSFVRELKCRHAFHHSCIREWFEMNCSCPVCRVNVPAEMNAIYKFNVERGEEGSKEIVRAHITTKAAGWKAEKY